MAIGFRMCVCGHEESVRGKGVRRGQCPSSLAPCQKCAYLLGAIRGHYKGPHRPTPFDHFDQFGARENIREGAEFSYALDYLTIHCCIVAVEREGGQLLGVSAPAYSVGGKTEHDWSRSRASYAAEHIIVRIMVDPGITGVAPFEVAQKFRGHF